MEDRKLDAYFLTPRNIIIKYDEIMFIQQMSENMKAQLPEEEEDFTDDSEMEDQQGMHTTMKTKLGIALGKANIERCIVPKEEYFRPKRPRVESVWFHHMMSKPQKLDILKYLINCEQLNVKWTDVICYYNIKDYLSNTFFIG
jgi:hypothetical protein